MRANANQDGPGDVAAVVATEPLRSLPRRAASPAGGRGRPGRRSSGAGGGSPTPPSGWCDDPGHPIRGLAAVARRPADLPWAAGVVYLGCASHALVPTTLRCSVPVSLVVAALAPAEVTVLLPGVVLQGAMPRRSANPELLAALTAEALDEEADG